MTIEMHDVIGAFGVTLIVVTYFALQSGRLASGFRYSVLNGAGAAMILYSLIFDFNLPAFLVEFFWLLISIYGIYRSMLEVKRGSQPSS